MAMDHQREAKIFPPLESDPVLFTRLLHNLGASRSLHLEDVVSLDPALLSTLIAGKILAFVLISPTEGAFDYRARIAREPDRIAALSDEEKRAAAEDVIWVKQTIPNACGFYALLHAFLNAPSGNTAEAGSLLDSVAKAGSREERVTLLETSDALYEAYLPIALQGQTAVNDDWSFDPAWHYVCFVSKKGRVWELEGGRLGPIIWGEGDGIEEVVKAVGKSIEEHGEGTFSLLALVDGSE